MGIPSLNQKDRYHGYLPSTLSYVEAALQGVDHEVFVTPPSAKLPWAGLVECQNLIVEKFLSGDYSHLWLVELDVQVPPEFFSEAARLKC